MSNENLTLTLQGMWQYSYPPDMNIPTQLKSDICSTNVPTFCVQCIFWRMCGLHSMKKSICKHESTGLLHQTCQLIQHTQKAVT